MSGVQDSLLYSRVETILASEIVDGDLRVGDQLPTEQGASTSSEFVACAWRMVFPSKELSGFVEDMHAASRRPA
jgi:hypothetical protein